MNKKKRTKDNNKVSGLSSIQSKVSLLLVFFTTVILLFLGIYQIYKIKEELDIQLIVTNQNTATKLSNHIELPMWQLDSVLVDKSLNSEFLTPDVYAIVVKDESDQLFTGLARDDQWKPQPFTDISQEDILREREDLIASTKRVSHKSRIIGRVTLFSTKRFNEERIQQKYVEQGITILAIGLILIVVTFLVLKFMVIRRVNKLSDTALEMSNGRFFDKLEIEAEDELGKLASSLNMLNKSYQIARDQLKSI
ncbi:MAG: hypothetical protein ACRBHB_02755 [Arenicella sp.]